MDITGIRQCPFCELRFTNHNELESHLHEDHPDRVVPDHISTIRPGAAAPGSGRAHTWS
ncbi:MAG TPA: hypothetical protein VFW24_15800 [Acidimicrobiales bacterium]|nr:hypothetical protein [Acidimicrobiales bacterium]